MEGAWEELVSKRRGAPRAAASHAGARACFRESEVVADGKSGLQKYVKASSTGEGSHRTSKRVELKKESDKKT